MRFYGEIGFGNAVETAPGVWEDTVVTRLYRGSVLRNTRRLQDGENLNDDLSVNNSISIVADAYATENFHAMRYIKWSGTLWKVSEVEVQRPRLLLRLGGVYHGSIGTPVTP